MIRTMDHDSLHERLSAYLDGELDAAEAQTVEQLLRDSEEARTALRRLEKATSLLRELPRHAAPPTIAEDVLARIERQALLDDEPARGSTTRTRGQTRVWRWSMAAGVVLSVTAGMWAFTSLRRDYRERQSPVAMGARKSQESLSLETRGKDPERETDPLARKTETRPPSRLPVSTTPPSPERNEVADPTTAVLETLGYTSTAIRDHSNTLAVKDGPLGSSQGSRRASREAARLRIEVNDARQRDLVVDHLSKRLQDANVTLDTDWVDDSSSGSAARNPSSYRFQEGRRFEQGDRKPEGRQILVQAPPALISRVTEEAARANPSSRVQLEADGSRYEGLAATQSQLLAMTTADEDSRSGENRRMRADKVSRDNAGFKRSQATPKRANGREDHPEESLSSLWSAFGLDPDLLQALLPREPAESKNSEDVIAAGPRPPLAPTSPVERTTNSDLMGPPQPEMDRLAFADGASSESLVARRLRELDTSLKKENVAARREATILSDSEQRDYPGSSDSAGASASSAGSSTDSSGGSGRSDTANPNLPESDQWSDETTAIHVIIEIVPVEPAPTAPSPPPSLTPDAAPKPSSKLRGTS